MVHHSKVNGKCKGLTIDLEKWLVGQAVKTPASHAGNGGSIPPRVTIKLEKLNMNIYTLRCDKYICRKTYKAKLVLMTLRVHLFPSRTQKLSSVVPKILGW